MHLSCGGMVPPHRLFLINTNNTGFKMVRKVIAVASFTAGAAAGTFIGTGIGKVLARKPKELIAAKDQAIDNLKEEVRFWRDKFASNQSNSDYPFE